MRTRRKAPMRSTRSNYTAVQSTQEPSNTSLPLEGKTINLPAVPSMFQDFTGNLTLFPRLPPDLQSLIIGHTIRKQCPSVDFVLVHTSSPAKTNSMCGYIINAESDSLAAQFTNLNVSRVDKDLFLDIALEADPDIFIYDFLTPEALQRFTALYGKALRQKGGQNGKPLKIHLSIRQVISSNRSTRVRQTKKWQDAISAFLLQQFEINRLILSLDGQGARAATHPWTDFEGLYKLTKPLSPFPGLCLGYRIPGLDRIAQYPLKEDGLEKMFNARGWIADSIDRIMNSRPARKLRRGVLRQRMLELDCTGLQTKGPKKAEFWSNEEDEDPFIIIPE